MAGERGVGPIGRLLVANRGEIARRVFRAARGLGIETVAVFADDDSGAPHVTEADRAVRLGAGPLAHTYLDVERVVAAAVSSGADAVHPGYGFLSEDPRLAAAVAAAGLVWVGPPPAAMALMGDKSRAKLAVAAAGVPVLDGVDVGEAGGEDLAEMGRRVGFPLLVKASAGGGGRGMRFVASLGELAAAVDAARREAEASFGSGAVFLERYVTSPRHVEVQVVADRHGNVVHLFDRECSIQRRHQKVVEEAPASLVPEPARRVMWKAAVDAARAVAYEGVGTVEFVVSGAGDAAFLEMNTRLQVEHGITELVTGIDLVRLQLSVAAGLPLGFTQDEVTVTGHAVEARLCAERPRDGFRPTPGTVVHARWPESEGIRVDAAVESGSVVGAAYDSLVAKVMAAGGRRDEAVARLRAALGGALELDGVETNRSLLAAVMRERDFLAGDVATDYLDRHPEVVGAAPDPDVRRRHAIAAALFLEYVRAGASVVPGPLGAWRNVGRPGHRDRFDERWEGGEWSVGLCRSGDGWEVSVSGPSIPADWADPLSGTGTRLAVRAEVRVSPGEATGTVDLEIDGVRVGHRVRRHGTSVAVSSAEGQSTWGHVEDDAAESVGQTAGELRAPLPGSIVRVLVVEGATVTDDDAMVVLEAMKMEHTLRATGPGVVRQVRAAVGAQVDVGDLLVTVDPVGTGGDAGDR
jgi:acetyl/propionyl-CoA carboxylase alpha subunit